MSDLSTSLPAGGVGVDVGAEPDKDDWTGRMLDRVGPEGRVYAFEPDPEKFLRLKGLYGDRPNAVLEMKAAAEADGPVPLVKSGTHYSLLYKGVNPLEAEGVSLDSYFRDKPRVDCLKIDVEGGEYRVLQGCRSLVAANPGIHIYLELHLEFMAAAGITAAVTFSLLGELGLAVGHRLGEAIGADDFARVGNGCCVVLWRGGGQ